MEKSTLHTTLKAEHDPEIDKNCPKIYNVSIFADLKTKCGLTADHFSSLVCMRTKSAIADLLASTGYYSNFRIKSTKLSY